MRNLVKQAFSDFYVGWKESSAWLWGPGALMALCLVTFSEWVLRSEIIFRLPEKHILRSSKDDATHVAYSLSRIRQSPDSRIPVYLLGSSAFREAVPKESLLEASMDKGIASKFKFTRLIEIGQTPGGVYQLVKALPPGPGVVILGTSFVTFSHVPTYYVAKYKNSTLQAPVPEVEAMLIAEGVRWNRSPFRSNALLEHLEGWLAQRRKPLRYLRFSIEYEHNLIHEGDRASQEKLDQWHSRFLVEDLASFKAHHEFNNRVFRRAIELAVQRGFSVVVLRLPISDSGKELLGAEFRTYLNIVKKIVEDFALPYSEFVDHLALQESDFYDPIHLSGEGRRKFTAQFADSISVILRERFQDVKVVSR